MEREPTHEADSALPDPKPEYLPAGFDLFPDHPLRGVSQPLFRGEKPPGWSSETPFRSRQYVAGLIDGKVPGKTLGEEQQFLQEAPRIIVDVWAAASRPGFFDPLSNAGLSEIEVAGHRAWYGPGSVLHVLVVDRGEWVLQVRAPGTVDRDDLIRIAGSVALAQPDS